MTRIYLSAPAHFSGEVALTYDEAQRLSVLDFSGADGLPDSARCWILQKLPVEYIPTPALLQFFRQNGFQAVAETVEITFEMFWDTYDHKLNAKRTRQRWERLSKADRAKAYAGIRPYFRYLASTGYMNKKNPDTYLLNRSWEDERARPGQKPPPSKPKPIRSGETSIKDQLDNYAKPHPRPLSPDLRLGHGEREGGQQSAT